MKAKRKKQQLDDLQDVAIPVNYGRKSMTEEDFKEIDIAVKEYKKKHPKEISGIRKWKRKSITA